MKFKELAAKVKFKSTPALYFGPQELDKAVGEYPFIIQFIDEEVPDKTKNKKIYWSMTIDIIKDNRVNTKDSPISPGRYRFDLTEENMSKLNKMQFIGVDIFASPLEFIHGRRYKGKHIYSDYAFIPMVSASKAVTASNPVAAPVTPVKATPATSPSSETDDCSGWFPEDDERRKLKEQRDAEKAKAKALLPVKKQMPKDDEFDYDFDEE